MHFKRVFWGDLKNLFTTLECVYYTKDMKWVAIVCIFIALVFPAPSAAGDSLDGPLTAEVVRVLDGDTLDVRIKVWLGQTIETRVRINGIDTPKMRSKCSREKEMAVAAKSRLADLIGDTVTLRHIKNGKYAGRVVADLDLNGESISSILIKEGHARAYGGKARKSWCEAI